MVYRLGLIVAAVFAGLSLLHLYWAAGGRLGSAVTVPTRAGYTNRRVINPSPRGTSLVAAALLVAMLVVLGRLGVWGASVPGWIFLWGTWGIALLFLLRAVGEFRYVGFFKSVRDTPFAYWDTWLFSPLCLFVGVVACLVARHRP